MNSIDEIMDVFNFDRVHNFMEQNRLEWYDSDKKAFEVPSVQKIRELARELLQEACTDNLRYVTTGGFSVIRTPYDLHLIFELESYMSDIEKESK